MGHSTSLSPFQGSDKEKATVVENSYSIWTRICLDYLETCLEFSLEPMHVVQSLPSHLLKSGLGCLGGLGHYSPSCPSVCEDGLLLID